MVKLQTKTAKELFDKRNNSIGNHIIKLIVNSITASANGVVASGFYYYELEEQQITLDAFNTSFNWETVEQAESQLPNFDATSLKNAFIQRIVEFSMIQQQIESGSNFGTNANDWEVCM